jgi:polar amino acid transport system substrate-binding protein
MKKFLFQLVVTFFLTPANTVIAESETMVWGFSDYPPFKYKEDGEYKGIDVLLMNDIAESLGVKIEYVECPFKRCLELMKSGRIDFMTAIGMRDDRKDYVDFIFPPYNEKNAKVLYFKKGSAVKIDKFEDMYKYSIGVKNGVSYFPRFDEDNKIDKQVVNEVEINLRKLEQSRIDAAMNTEIQMDYLILKLGYEGVFEKSLYRDESGMDFIGISKKSKYAARKKEIESIVDSMVKSGHTKAVVAEFFVEIQNQMKRFPSPVELPSSTPPKKDR